MGLAVIAGLALNCRAPLPSLRAELPAGRLSAIVFVAAEPTIGQVTPRSQT